MANLASIILEGVNINNSVLENNYDFSDSVVVESSYVDSAVATLFTDIMEAEQSWMVADVVGAATVIRESKLGNDIDAVAVVENIIKSGIEKLKAAFKKFIAKIKEYFTRVINWFKAMFSNGEKFAKTYGTLIKEKAVKVKGYSYKGYKYTYSAGKAKCDAERKAVQAVIETTIGTFDSLKEYSKKSELVEALKKKGALKGTFKEEEAQSSTEVMDEYLSDRNFSDMTNMREELTEVFVDGATAEITITDFSENSVTEMLDLLKAPNEKINAVTKQQTTFDNTVSAIIKKLNSLEKNDKEADSANIVSNASYLSSLLTGYLNIYKVPCEVEIAVLKDMGKKYLSVLKGFYNYKGNKDFIANMDSYIPFEMSVIESADPDDDEPEGDGDGNFGKGGKDCTESAISSILEMANHYGF